MTVKIIADTFPAQWSYGHYEQEILRSIEQQIHSRWPNSDSLLLNTTWMGPQTYDQITVLEQQGQQFDQLIVVSTVDAVENFVVYPLIERLQKTFGIEQVYRVGNFDGDYEFNLFAIACADNFKQYNTNDLVLQTLRWRYCCYNRKPYTHRLTLVRELVEQGLELHGVITLGRAFPGQPDHELYRSIGERNDDYRQWGHWYSDSPNDTSHDIPHDLYSLHNWSVWSQHFLHIVGATAPHNEPDIFVNQINFKPLIGMRPFVINGQTRQYQYLRRHGFRTFNHYWPQFDLEQGYYGNTALARTIVDLVKWLVEQSDQEIMAMYQDMLPALEHNRLRWAEWAQEQKSRVHCLFT